MRRALLAAFGATVLLGIALSGLAAQAETAPPKQIAARVELHAIPTLTLSDQQFLSGDANARSDTVAGEFRIAQGSGKLPVVIMLHGSGGIGGNTEVWAQYLNAMGISTFAIDGFTGRGLVTVNTDQARLGRLNSVLDVYRALDILAKHPRVDPNRIALMGFSRGGQGALYASLARFHKLWNKSGVQLAAYIPLYPDCATTYVGDTETVDRPIRIFHGTPDDYNPVASCRTYVARLQELKRDVLLTEYPESQHSFDSPLAVGKVLVATDNQTVRACSIRETDGGLLINTASGKQFTYKDECVQLNPHVGGNAAATEAAHIAVADLLRQVFKLE